MFNKQNCKIIARDTYPLVIVCQKTCYISTTAMAPNSTQHRAKHNNDKSSQKVMMVPFPLLVSYSISSSSSSSSLCIKFSSFKKEQNPSLTESDTSICCFKCDKIDSNMSAVSFRTVKPLFCSCLDDDSSLSFFCRSFAFFSSCVKTHSRSCVVAARRTVVRVTFIAAIGPTTICSIASFFFFFWEEAYVIFVCSSSCKETAC
mmetsp:Transcript_19325/g.28841  ORF Transcript_19325/g.28841 Transcript_19325/m.28841 type:complete len:203 (+) Transcript_19325:126-734(+)